MVVIIAAAGLCEPSVAFGQSAADRAAAETLFREGRELVAAGRDSEACPKLAESQRLDPGTGTLLALAQCHEHLGKLASAWAEYTEALKASQKAGRADRVQFAQEGIQRVEPRVPRLAIRLAPGLESLAGLKIERDGSAVGLAATGSAVPVDPGEHVVIASAPGHATFTARQTVQPGDRSAVVEVPLLVPERSPVQPSTDNAALTRTPPPVVVSKGGWGWQEITGIALAGIGVASAAGGAYFGLHASSSWSDFKSRCDGARCPTSTKSAYDDASSSATLSTVFFTAGAIGIVGGAVLFFAAPKATKESPTTGPSVVFTPHASATGGGFSMNGRF